MKMPNWLSSIIGRRPLVYQHTHEQRSAGIRRSTLRYLRSRGL